MMRCGRRHLFNPSIYEFHGKLEVHLLEFFDGDDYVGSRGIFFGRCDGKSRHVSLQDGQD